MAGSAIVDIRNTFGAALVGLFVSNILMGITIIQTWTYYWEYRNRDPRILKGFVATLVILDCLQTILCLHALYWYLILNYGNAESLQFNMWSMNIQGTIAVFVSYLVQLFYARRVYILSKRVVLPVLIACTGTIYFAFGVVYVVKIFIVKQYSRYASLTWVACIGLGAVCLTDILIAMSMCWTFYWNRTGYTRTDSTLMTLMSYCITTGLLSSIIASAAVIAYVIAPTSLLPEAIFWALVKCHVNSFLAMLNGRDSIRERAGGMNTMSSFCIGSFKAARQGDTSESTTPTVEQTSVSVSMYQSAITDYTPSRHDSNNNPTSLPDVEKQEGTTPYL